MKRNIILIWSLIILQISCLSRQNETISNTNKEEEISTGFEENLFKIFGKVDSTKILNSIGCVQGYFAYVSPEFGLRIPESIYSEQESNKEYILEESKIVCELFVFKTDSSHLANIFTDIIFINYPKPLRIIKSVKGKINVLIGNKEQLWGNEVNNAYIKIVNLEFIDTLNNKRKIEIKEKYLWKVLNLGTPG